MLRVSGAARDLTDREIGPGLVLHPEHAHGLDHLDETDRRRVEALVPPGSPLIGHTPRELLMAERYNAVLLAIRRHGNPVTAQLRDTRFESGDVLLLVSTAKALPNCTPRAGSSCCASPTSRRGVVRCRGRRC